MSTTVRGPTAAIKALLAQEPALSAASKAQKAKVEQVEEKLEAVFERVVSSGVQIPKDVKPIVVLEQVAPALVEELKVEAEEQKRLGPVAHSFSSLCQALSNGPYRAPAVEIGPASARYAYEALNRALGDAKSVKKALAAAGECPATANFPVAQLEAVTQRLEADIDAIVKTAEKRIAPTEQSLRLRNLGDFDANAAELGKRLGKLDLAGRLEVLRDGTPKGERAELEKNVAAYLTLLDGATNIPDYATDGTGWHQPQSRKWHRERTFDGWTRYASADRQDAARDRFGAELEGLLKEADPRKALGEAVQKGFMREIGLSAEAQKGIKVDLGAVRRAIDAELLAPLRALNEAIGGIAADHPKQSKAILKVVADVTKHICEGDYREWRYTSDIGKQQLSRLDANQREKWMAPHSVTSPTHKKGLEFKTREEDDLELLWVTKIGGPSHGFDVGSKCLLPLLANARTKTILVDDPRWPHNASARSYLRLLFDKQDKPVLYLEPLQRDFPHRQQFDQGKEGRAEDMVAQMAILSHAISKARELGVPLSVPPYLANMLEELEVPYEDAEASYLLTASAGVFEASDTLGFGHDWPHPEDKWTPKLERLHVLPE